MVALVAIGSSGPPTTTKATQKTYTQEETDIRLAAHTWIYLNHCGGGASPRTQATLLLVYAELDPAYCDVIVERWQTFTGKKAVRDGDKYG